MKKNNNCFLKISIKIEMSRLFEFLKIRTGKLQKKIPNKKPSYRKSYL